MLDLLAGLDLISLAVAAFFFAIFLLVFYNIIWHTYHGKIGSAFIMAIVGFFVLGAVLLLLGVDVFNLI